MVESIFDLQAELCKTMANATRLQIVHALREGPHGVNDLANEIGLDQAKVSQHLAILRSRGVVVAQRQGSGVHYRITNPKIERICDLMREVLAEQVAERSELIEGLEQHR
jgi:ArsR family transcriptional regulator, virulence genes transcriptional regulator